ncbi:MAG TPA: hypothetical protein VMH01_07240, partial [Puia sp.]|nr:hypothetical protein [Puia sp.]
MFPKTSPLRTQAWQRLQDHYGIIRKAAIKDFFQADPDRFTKFSLFSENLLFDYSKNIITDETISLLIQLANECGLKEAIEAMFTGEKINQTENRSVLHIALRNLSPNPIYSDGIDVMPEVSKVLEQMKGFSKKIHSGEWKGYTGRKIKYIVNIGIGGSDLGPSMVTEALRPYWLKEIETYFVSNVDGTHIVETLKKIKPDETLFLIASKTFTTQETMT